MTRIFTSIALLASLGAVAGCSSETIDSSDIKTRGIAALIEVKAENESSSRVYVKLLAGGSSSNTSVILGNGDQLTATANGETKKLSADGEGEYLANFATGAADTEFVVAFERDDGDNAPNSVGKLPPPFTVGAIDPKSRAADDVLITWDPSGSDSITIKVDGDCIKSVSDIKTSDTGSYNLTKDKLEAWESQKEDTCDVRVQIWRTRSGAADTAWDNESRMTMVQVRAVKFQSAP